jgi:hypothetical protein
MIKNGRYRHYKGNDYQVLNTVRHSETEETLVLYKPLYERGSRGKPECENLWVRPLAMFSEMVEVEGKETPRFAYMGEK